MYNQSKWSCFRSESTKVLIEYCTKITRTVLREPLGQGQSQYTGSSYGITSSILRFIIVKLVVFDMGICHCQEAVALWLRYKVNKKDKNHFFFI